MANKELKLMVFAHLGLDWAPCGRGFTRQTNEFSGVSV